MKGGSNKIMNKEEFNSVIAECVEDNERITLKAEDIVTAFNESIETTEALKQEVNALKEKNDELRKECQKWLMRQTFKQEENPIETKPTYEELTQQLKAKMKGN